MQKLDFKYLKLTSEEKEDLLKSLKRELESVEGIVFAYVHGGFIEREVFRDVDVAVWIKNLEDAYNYEVGLSVKLEANLRVPIDLHVLNKAPLPFKHYVFIRGKLLLSKDEKTRIKIVEETLRQYMDVRLLNKTLPTLKY